MSTTQTTTADNIDEETSQAALFTRARPMRPSALSVSLTFGWRALLKIRHVPEQLIDVTGLPIIFTLMFTYLFGGALAGSPSEYVDFLLPGSLVMAVLLVTVYAGVALNSDITTGVLDRFRSLPIWRPALIVGGLLGDAGRYLIASVLVVSLGFALGFRPGGGVAGVLSGVALIVVFAFALSWVWTAIGLIMRTPNSVQQAGLLVLFPLTLASNVFVDPETMPGWLQAFIDINPIAHVVSAVRGLMQGTATSGQIRWVFLASLILVTVFAPLTMRLYRTKS